MQVEYPNSAFTFIGKSLTNEEKHLADVKDRNT